MIFEKREPYQKNNSTILPNKEDILNKLGINNVKEWKAWIKKNHPDKGGDLKLCQEVMRAVKDKG